MAVEVLTVLRLMEMLEMLVEVLHGWRLRPRLIGAAIRDTWRRLYCGAANGRSRIPACLRRLKAAVAQQDFRAIGTAPHRRHRA